MRELERQQKEIEENADSVYDMYRGEKVVINCGMLMACIIYTKARRLLEIAENANSVCMYRGEKLVTNFYQEEILNLKYLLFFICCSPSW